MNTKSKKPNPVTFAKALADPTRQKIMELACCDWLNVSEIVEVVGVSQPTVSHHLAILKDAGLVKTRSEGKHTYYTLNQERVVNCCGQIIEVFAPETEAAERFKKDDSEIL
jgi:ArsR family transcriptional regulator